MTNGKNAAGKTSDANRKEKRIGVCLDCGYEWEARNPNLPRPPRCSQCGNKVNTAWKDELSEEQLQEIAPMLHGLKEKIISLFNTPEDDDKKKYIMPIVRKGKTGSLSESDIYDVIDDEEEPKAAAPRKANKPKEVYIPELNETVPLIENVKPAAESEDEEATLPHVAWENENGDIEYGAVVSKETADEVEDILTEKEEAAELTQPQPTVKDIEILKAAGLLSENESIPFEENKTEEETEEETEHKIKDKEKKKGGVPLSVVLLTGGVLIAVGISAFKSYKLNEEKETKEEGEKIKSGDYFQSHEYPETLPKDENGIPQRVNVGLLTYRGLIPKSAANYSSLRG